MNRPNFAATLVVGALVIIGSAYVAWSGNLEAWAAGSRSNLPDLYVSKIVRSPASQLTPGRIVTFSVTVRNKGKTEAAASETSFLMDGREAGRLPTNALAPRAEQVLTFTWTAKEGPHSAKFCADAGNAVEEQAENANCRIINFIVAMSDLVTTFKVKPTAPVTAGNVADFMVAVKNQGGGPHSGGDLENTLLRVRLRWDIANDGTWDAEIISPRPYDQMGGQPPATSYLAVNQTKFYNFGVGTNDQYVGTVRFEACADPESVIPEKKEDNNCQAGTFEVVAGSSAPPATTSELPNFKADPLTFRSPRIGTETAADAQRPIVRIEYSVRNNGNHDFAIPASGGVDERLRVDLANDGTWDIERIWHKIRPYETTSLEQFWRSAVELAGNEGMTTGTNRYEICADSEGQTPEFDEQDNCQTGNYAATSN